MPAENRRSTDTQDAVSRSQIASELASRLRAMTTLESVFVIPMDRLGFEGEVEQEFGHPPFSERLGSLAARQIAYELAFSIVMKTKQGGQVQPFRIGVAAGSTVRAIVEAFRVPREFSDKLKGSRIEIEVAPLAIGPIPETASSAGFIASSLCNRLRQSLPNVRFVPLTHKKAEEDGYRLRMDPLIRAARDNSPIQVSAKGDDEQKRQLQTSPLRFDWILTGVGSVNSGQLVEHLNLRIKDKAKRADLVTTVVGDICSRLYADDATEREKSDGDRFVGISFDWLKYLANARSHGLRHNRIVAVTGGEEKYQAILPLVRNSIKTLRKKNWCLFNSLVTDEFTARRLLDDLGQEVRHAKRPEWKPEDD